MISENAARLHKATCFENACTLKISFQAVMEYEVKFIPINANFVIIQFQTIQYKVPRNDGSFHELCIFIAQEILNDFCLRDLFGALEEDEDFATIRVIKNDVICAMSYFVQMITLLKKSYIL